MPPPDSRVALTEDESPYVTANARVWDRLAGEQEVPPNPGLTWGWWRWPED
ncbi:MAG: hypothetical protein ACRDRX_03070 [Pseudonocardiaceae bacterium]